MSILRPALLRFSFAFQMPPLGLLVALLSHGLASAGELWLFLDHGGRTGYLPLVMGNALLFALFMDKALRKHVLSKLLKQPTGRRLLFSLCPLGSGVALTAYLLKVLGLALLSAEEPRYLLVMLAESSMVVVLASRVVLTGRRRFRKQRRADGPEQFTPHRHHHAYRGKRPAARP